MFPSQRLAGSTDLASPLDLNAVGLVAAAEAAQLQSAGAAPAPAS